jgi:hypothetical protein
MKGHIRERSPGRWAIVIEMRDPESGRRKRKWHSFSGTKREAQIACARLISEVKVGTYIEPSRTTLAQFLERWLNDVQSRVTPKTHERYAQICHKNIAPVLGAVLLAKLKPEQIAEAYAKALVTGRRRGTGGLAPRTVRQMHAILKSALAQAVKWEILVRNPAAAVRGPKVGRVPMQTYDLEQTADLIGAAQGTRVFIPILLAVLGGLRPRGDRGPALARGGSRGCAIVHRPFGRTDAGRGAIQGAEERARPHHSAFEYAGDRTARASTCASRRASALRQTPFR